MNKCDDCNLYVDFGNCFLCKGNTCEKEVRADERSQILEESKTFERAKIIEECKTVVRQHWLKGSVAYRIVKEINEDLEHLKEKKE